MDARTKMRAGCQPLLAEGERIDSVAFAQSPIAPFIGPAILILALVPMVALRPFGLVVVGVALAVTAAIALLVLTFAVRSRVLCWTDRSLVVLKTSAWRVSPTVLLERLPRGTRIGPLNGIWAKVQVGGESLAIHRRYHGDVATAEEAGTPSAQSPA